MRHGKSPGMRAAFCGTAVLIIASAPLVAGQDVLLRSSGPAAVVFEVRTPDALVDAVLRFPTLAGRTLAPGWALRPQAGGTEAPVRSVLIQVPPSGGITLSVLEAEYDILPAPALEAPASVPGSARPRAAAPEPLTIVESRATIRGVPVARLLVRPFQRDEAGGRIRTYRRLVVQAAFDRPASGALGASPIDPREEEMFGFRETILNYSPSGRAPAPRPQGMASGPFEGAHSGVRLEVAEDGIYEFSMADLKSAGLPPAFFNRRDFRLFDREREVPLEILTGATPEATRFRFYGQGLNTPYTGTNVYWMNPMAGRGRPMERTDGTPAGGAASAALFQEKIRFEQNLSYWAGTPGAPESDFWFWEKLTAPMTASYTLSLPDPVAGGAALLRISFQGRSTAPPSPNHHVVVRLNGQQIINTYFDGMGILTTEAPLDASLLQPGANTLQVVLPNDRSKSEVIYLNWVEIEYPRSLKAVGDSLRFALASGGRQRIAVDGFSGTDIKIYDITDPEAVRTVGGAAVEAGGTGYRLVFEDDTTGGKTYLALASSNIRAPGGGRFAVSGTLRRPDIGADLIMITSREMLASLVPLYQARKRQGLRAVLVDVEQIYNEFSGGVVDPGAIRDFLRYAYADWIKPAPLFVLLAGDANIDFRDYFQSGKKNIVPPALTWTTVVGLVPDDFVFACVDGDDLVPDLAVGRLPGATPAALSGIVGKILEFEKTPAFSNQVVLVADADTSFEADCDVLGRIAGNQGFPSKKIYRRLYGSVDAARADLIQSVNAGALLTSYFGHGSVTGWAAKLFESTDIPSLANTGRLTFMTTWNCLNGFFAQPFSYCLAEELLLPPQTGAIGVFAPSGGGYIPDHRRISQDFFGHLFIRRISQTGVLAVRTKISAYAQGASEEALHMYTLFGDPATELRLE